VLWLETTRAQSDFRSVLKRESDSKKSRKNLIKEREKRKLGPTRRGEGPAEKVGGGEQPQEERLRVKDHLKKESSIGRALPAKIAARNIKVSTRKELRLGGEETMKDGSQKDRISKNAFRAMTLKRASRMLKEEGSITKEGCGRLREFKTSEHVGPRRKEVGRKEKGVREKGSLGGCRSREAEAGFTKARVKKRGKLLRRFSSREN